MFRTRIVPRLLEWFAKNARDLPWRRTKDPYAIWVSEIMLQQTQVKTVIPYWTRWMRALPDVESLARARPQRLHKLWEGLGYYTRVRNMQKAARVICERHQGRFPENYDHVLDLPGIGRYTAGAICSIAFNQPTAVLDGNVIRVLSRLFAVKGDPRDRQVNARLWSLAHALVESSATGPVLTPAQPPQTTHSRPRQALPLLRGPAALNQALMELGALVCTPSSPKCAECPVRGSCAAFHQDRVLKYPQTSPRAKPTPRRFLAFVAADSERVLVRQRPAGVVNGHLWELPNLEAKNGTTAREAALRVLGIRKNNLEPLCTIRHSITRYRIAMDVFRVEIRDPAKAERCSGGKWVPKARLGRLPFASAHAQALRLALQ